MPLYEYQCQQCGRRTEKIQKFSDPEITTCPHCSGVLERTQDSARPAASSSASALGSLSSRVTRPIGNSSYR